MIAYTDETFHISYVSQQDQPVVTIMQGLTLRSSDLPGNQDAFGMTNMS